MCTCGRRDEQHAWFDREQLETMWAQGIVLTMCGETPEGAVCLVTTESVTTPDNPHTEESLLEISS